MKTTKVATIHQTTNYSAFMPDPSNRPFSPNPKLRKSMEQYGFLDAFPIMVVIRNGKMIVLDGQYRFNHAKDLGLPVKYVICDEVPGLTIPDLQVGKQWSTRDHVEARITMGDPHCKHLKEFAANNQLPLGIAAALLANIDPRSGATKLIRDQKFQFTSDGMNTALRVVAVINATRSASRDFVKYTTHHLFVNALRLCFAVRKFSEDRLIKKIIAHPYHLKVGANLDQFLEMIELIYNYKSGDKLNLAFLAKQEAGK